MKDSEYKQEIEEMAKMYNDKETELNQTEKELDYYKLEILSMYGVIRILSKSAKHDYLELDCLFQTLEMLENRLNTVVETIIGTEDID
tara:strand:+ start:525 stop:788 length:264 start_codon:yes stop_codon:yes gene_type:complete